MLMSRKILIVEDWCDLLDLLGEALALLGWETVLAESGREAMNKLEQDLPNVVLLDLRTPVMDGFDLAATLKTHPVYKNIPILAVTGQSWGPTRERCLAAGCDDFIATLSELPSLEKRLTKLMSVERFNAMTATGLEGWPPMGGNQARALPTVRR
jgi:two-component system, cell cycle response regulator DivK